MKRFAALALLPLGLFAQERKPKPAFAGQTEAPRPAKASGPLNVETIATGLTGAWAMAFLPDGNILVTLNEGQMRIVHPKEQFVSAPLAGVPPVKEVAAQGLHDLLLDPDFARNRTLYFTYFAPPKGEAPGSWPIEHFYENVWTRPFAERRTMQLGFERVARAKLSADSRSLEDVETLAEGAERRIVLAPDGKLFVTGADRFRFYDSDLDGVEHDFTDNPDIRRNFSGRVLRINRDGSIPRDNPWLTRATVPADTFAHGFKDPEGAAINPQTGELWAIDHGPQGGDEVNIVRAGKDYGWPDVSYGTQYDARQSDGRKNVPVGNGKSAMEGVEQPIYFWVPSIAPSGMAFYTGNLFPDWKNNLIHRRNGRATLSSSGPQRRPRRRRRETLDRPEATHPRGPTGPGRRAIRLRGQFPAPAHAQAVGKWDRLPCPRPTRAVQTVGMSVDKAVCPDFPNASRYPRK